MSELMTFSLINKKVVTNDMQSVTTMAQMWGFRPLKAKAFFGTPAGHRNSPPDCFYPSDCPVRIPLFIFGADVGIRPLKAKAFFGTPAGTETVHRTVSILWIALFESRSLFLAQMWGFEPQKPR